MTVTASTTTTPDLRVLGGMVGFPSAVNFALTGGADGVFEMECLDEEGLGFVVIAPEPYFPDYAPVIDAATAASLDLHEAADALLLLVVTLGDENRPPSANLLAPVVVNRRTRVASQVVLTESSYPLRAPFLD